MKQTKPAQAMELRSLSPVFCGPKAPIVESAGGVELTESGAPIGRWKLGEVVDGDELIRVAYRQDIPAATKQALTRQFIVEWAFSGDCDEGLPTPSQLQPALEFQALVQPALEDGGAAILAILSTGHGYREMYFYCADPVEAQRRLNECVAGREFPVALHAGDDPEWHVFAEFTEPFVDDAGG